MSHLHLNEPSLICEMCLNSITYLLTYLLTYLTEKKTHLRTKKCTCTKLIKYSLQRKLEFVRLDS